MFVVVVLVFLGFLFPPSFVGESLPSLLLFRLVVMSMGSVDVVTGDDVDPIYPTPPLGQDMTQGQFFKRSLTGFNSVFLLLD